MFVQDHLGNQSILVTGTSRPYDRIANRAARMVAFTLVGNGFSLVTGNAPGVDKTVSSSYCFELARVGGIAGLGYTQLRLPWFSRGSLLPIRSYRASSEMTVRLKNRQDWLEEARARADAVVMLGGRKGALSIVNRFIDSGKPVFPVPFTGGQSNEVFREILRNWCDNPVPGLSRSQSFAWRFPGHPALARWQTCCWEPCRSIRMSS